MHVFTAYTFTHSEKHIGLLWYVHAAASCCTIHVEKAYIHSLMNSFIYTRMPHSYLRLIFWVLSRSEHLG